MIYTTHFSLPKETIDLWTSCSPAKYLKSLLAEKQLTYFEKLLKKPMLHYIVHLKSDFSCKKQCCKILL